MLQRDDVVYYKSKLQKLLKEVEDNKITVEIKDNSVMFIDKCNGEMAGYTKLMDTNTYLIEENKRLQKCYDITNESWKQLYEENIKLHRVFKYIQRIINKPFSVYLLSKPEYNQLKKLIYDVENMEVANEEVCCGNINDRNNSNNGSLSGTISDE